MKKNFVWFFMALFFLGTSAYLFFQKDEEFVGVCRAEIQKFEDIKKRTQFLPIQEFSEPKAKASQYSSGLLAGQGIHWAFQVNSTGFGALHCDGRYMDPKNKLLARLFVVAIPNPAAMQAWPEASEMDSLFQPCSARKLNNPDRDRLEVMKLVNELLQTDESQTVYWSADHVIKSREIPVNAELKFYEYSLLKKSPSLPVVVEYRIQSPLKETSLQNIELQRRLSSQIDISSEDALAQCLVDLQDKVDAL
jgi:hypothetical protein